MNREHANLTKPVFRWAIYLADILLVVIACLWLMGLAVGMGWSGRSDIQIAVLVSFVAATSFTTAILALASVRSAKSQRYKQAIVLAALACFGAPLGIFLIDSRILGL